MKYYPKNKIKTGLYTRGDEYSIIESNKSYIGKYWSTSDGKFFTGEGPTSKPYFELVKYIENNPQSEDYESPSPKISFIPDNLDEKDFNPKDNYFYAYLKGENVNKLTTLPTSYFPQPTEDDYKLGEFQRYFCVKTNELRYTEVTKDQYEKFKNKDESVAFQYYTPFTLSWELTGDKEQVYKVNRNIVLLTEQNIKRRGLQEFLRNNYLKFYKEESS